MKKNPLFRRAIPDAYSLIEQLLILKIIEIEISQIQPKPNAKTLMKTLSQKTIDQLESKGLKLFFKARDLVLVCKPISTIGNCIEGEIRNPIIELEIINEELIPKKEQFETDAPTMGIFIEKTGFKVEVWQWVPGPGPGDFEILVSTEEEVYDQVINYFFEENEYFSQYKARVMKDKNKG